MPQIYIPHIQQYHLNYSLRGWNQLVHYPMTKICIIFKFVMVLNLYVMNEFKI